MTVDTTIIMAEEPDLAPDAFREVLDSSGLGRQRPVGDLDRLRRMLAGATHVVTARDRADGRLLGVGRAISDGAWACYLSELAVCEHAKGRGVGRAIVSQLRGIIGPEVAVILASVPDAVRFYEATGLESLPNCFWARRLR